MQFILSHYGHRYLTHLVNSAGLDAALAREDVRYLCALLTHLSLPCEGNEAMQPLVARGFVEAVDDSVDRAAVGLRYARNPLENLRRVVFEYTTLCNLDCLHCRNTNLEARAEADPVGLRRVVDAALPIGLDRFDFIGGEVTLYGKGWLDLVAYIRAQGGAHASVITSGWFLGERDFWAAGRRYVDDAAYLAELSSCGLTHVVFSLDGPEAIHDRTRQVPGLYRRVIDGFAKVRAAGMQPRVSLVVGLGQSAAAARDWIVEVSTQLFGAAHDADVAYRRVLGDESNYVSNLIDVGAGVQLRRSRADLNAFSDDDLRCKNFFRPSPTLRIKSSGEISLCPLVDGGDGYGNVHERDPVELLNRLHEALVFRLHAERRIGEYRRFIDPEIFGGQLGHACSARTALNMVARAMEERAVDPDDRDALRAINVDVAEKMGVRARGIRHRANGHARPGAKG